MVVQSQEECIFVCMCETERERFSEGILVKRVLCLSIVLSLWMDHLGLSLIAYSQGAS